MTENLHVPTLESDRLVLRGWRDDDVPLWVAMGADPRVMRFFPATYEAEYATTMAPFRDRLEADGYGWWVLDRLAAQTGVLGPRLCDRRSGIGPPILVSMTGTRCGGTSSIVFAARRNDREDARTSCS